MGKSGITRCIIHKDIHKTVDSPAFQRWKMWITRLCIVEKWGKTPFLARRGSARLTLRLSGEWEAYALDTAGKRLAKHPLTRQADGAIALELDNFRYPEAVFAYELIRVK